MYVNFKLATTYGLILQDISVLQMISQNKFEDHADTLNKFEEEIEGYAKQDMVKFIQGTKKATKGSLVRLSDKGARILEEIQIPDVTADDLDVYGWLENVYKKNGKEVGNAKKTKSLIAHFRTHSGIERNHLVFLCKKFINDEREMEYSQKLEYLFWKPSNLFQTKFDIDQSRLFQYYLKNRATFDAEFEKIRN